MNLKKRLLIIFFMTTFSGYTFVQFCYSADLKGTVVESKKCAIRKFSGMDKYSGIAFSQYWNKNNCLDYQYWDKIASNRCLQVARHKYVSQGKLTLSVKNIEPPYYNGSVIRKTKHRQVSGKSIALNEECSAKFDALDCKVEVCTIKTELD